MSSPGPITRFLWRPWVPLIPIAYFAFRLATAPVSGWRLFSFGWMVLWFVLAIINWRIDGRFVAWIYSSDEPPADSDDVS